jgi:hypothetical protein
MSFVADTDPDAEVEPAAVEPLGANELKSGDDTCGAVPVPVVPNGLDDPNEKDDLLCCPPNKDIVGGVGVVNNPKTQQ